MVSRFLRLGAIPAARRFDRLTRDPVAAQRAVLRRILARNATTVAGRRYGFRHIATVDDFRRRVPVRDYEALRADAESMIGGAKGVLCRENPYFYSLTSGTASAPKLIPVTATFQRAGREATSTWLGHCLRAHPDFVGQKLLAVTSPAEEGRTGEGVPFGSASGRIYREAPFPLRRCYAVPYDVFEVQNYEDRYALIALFALQARLSGMVTPNPLTLLRVLEAAERNLEAIVRSLHDGTLDPALNGDALRRHLRPSSSRARARAIARLAERRSRIFASDLWPDLSLVACWTGASVGAQLPKLRTRLGAHVPVRDLGLVASEARLSIPVEDETPYGVLALGNAFFEFVPEEEMGEDPRTLLGHELIPGRRYRVLLTGWNGLYRYDINDVVEVGDTYNQTPRIAFVRKGRDMANLTGEKVHVNQLLAAVEEAAAALGLAVEAFKVIPNASELRYDFLIEPGPCVMTPRLAQELAAMADRALQSRNVEYDAKRRSLRLNGPSVSIMRSGWSDATLKHELERGKRDVQYKWRHLEETEGPLDAIYRVWSTDAARAAIPSRNPSTSPARLTRAG